MGQDRVASLHVESRCPKHLKPFRQRNDASRWTGETFAKNVTLFPSLMDRLSRGINFFFCRAAGVNAHPIPPIHKSGTRLFFSLAYKRKEAGHAFRYKPSTLAPRLFSILWAISLLSVPLFASIEHVWSHRSSDQNSISKDFRSGRIAVCVVSRNRVEVPSRRGCFEKFSNNIILKLLFQVISEMILFRSNDLFVEYFAK